MRKMIFALLGIAAVMSATAAVKKAVNITIVLKNASTVRYEKADVDSVEYVGGKFGETGAIGMKIYTKSSSYSHDYLYSQMTSVTIDSGGGEVDPNNVNANRWTEKYNDEQYMYNLEWPRVNEDDNTSYSVKSTPDYGVTLSLEWSNTLIANRWTCYQMHNGNSAKNVTRQDNFQEDPDLPADTRSKLSDYSGSGFSRGHLCPSADRLASRDQNSQTFYLSNMQPQWQSHNAGLWESIESKVRAWNVGSLRDTLYVVKAATIDDVTIGGTKSSGVYENQKCNGRLPVAKYFYCAVLAVKGSQYHAIGIWTTHSDDAQSSTTIRSCAITIDELERRTGIDFFCNLPDDIEAAVESSLDLDFWGL